MTDRQLIETVPLAAFEAQSERYTRIIAHICIGWAVCVIMLAVVLIFAISYEVETVEEAVETTTEVVQDADNYGRNYFAGGDMSNDGEANGYDYQENDGQNDQS